MKPRLSRGCLAALAVTLLVVAAAGWWYFASRNQGDSEKGAEAAPVAQVQVAPIRRGEIERTLVAYGTAASAPGGTRSLAYPFESRVTEVSANLGQTVAEGDLLLRIEPSADARLALDSARGAQAAADQALQEMRQRYQAHLATNSDLATAESADRDARLKFASLQGRARDAGGSVAAPAAGVVTKLPATPGTIVPAGAPLVELAVASHFEARIGIAPADAPEVTGGEAVHLTLVQARSEQAGKPTTVQGTVRLVGASVDPATRMVDAFVSLEDTAAPVIIGTYLRAEIVLEKKTALLVPREAVRPAPDGGRRATIFTLLNGKAAAHEVETGIDDGRSVEILSGGEGLAPGTDVITQGSYEVEDKMPVEVEKPAASGDKPSAGQSNPPEDKEL